MSPQIASLLITYPKYWAIVALVIFAVFCVWNRIEVSITSERDREKEDAFWARENEANSVRKKSLDNLDYITIPETLPYSLHPEDDEIAACIKDVNNLKSEKIVNFTGYTNTDLKMEYGAPNITILTKYDENFTAYITTLQKWADRLLELNEEEEAVKIMEYLISIKADISKTYKYLGERYSALFEKDKFDKLLETAEGLKSLNRDYLVKSLKSLEQD